MIVQVYEEIWIDHLQEEAEELNRLFNSLGTNITSKLA